jgi:hypothetical protein
MVPEQASWTQEDCERVCREWQQRLRLQDWDVRLMLVSSRELTEAKAELTVWIPKKRVATIRLVDPSDAYLNADHYDRRDVEVDIVHELLHLYTDGILGDRSTDSPENTCAEQMADAVARALVNLHREAQP